MLVVVGLASVAVIVPLAHRGAPDGLNVVQRAAAPFHHSGTVPVVAHTGVRGRGLSGQENFGEAYLLIY